MSTVKPIPEGSHTVIAGLTLAHCAQAMDWYERALGAERIMSMPAPDGKSVWHAEMRVGNTVLYMNDEMPGMSAVPPSAEHIAPVGFWIWTTDCDAAYKRAVDAGAKATMPPMDMFWGDRTGTVTDPHGYRWTFATHVKDMTPEEMAKAGDEFARRAGMKP